MDTGRFRVQKHDAIPLDAPAPKTCEIQQDFEILGQESAKPDVTVGMRLWPRFLDQVVFAGRVLDHPTWRKAF